MTPYAVCAELTPIIAYMYHLGSGKGKILAAGDTIRSVCRTHIQHERVMTDPSWWLAAVSMGTWNQRVQIPRLTCSTQAAGVCMCVCVCDGDLEP